MIQYQSSDRFELLLRFLPFFYESHSDFSVSFEQVAKHYKHDPFQTILDTIIIVYMVMNL